MAYTNQGTRDRSELPKAYRNTTAQGTRPAKVPYQKLSQLAFSLPWLRFSLFCRRIDAKIIYLYYIA